MDDEIILSYVMEAASYHNLGSNSMDEAHKLWEKIIKLKRLDEIRNFCKKLKMDTYPK